MTFQVEMLPSGHRFTVEAGDTLLDGALRSGLNVRYNCSSGSCGDCRARLISGKLGLVDHFDYVFREAEKQQGQFLLCRARAAGDLVIEALEASQPADIPHQEISTQAAGLETLSEDILTLQLRTPRSKTLWFLAGQHVTLHLDGLAPRSKSVASCPCNGRVLQFHVRRRPGDPFSDRIFDQLKLRDKISLEGPFGDFILDENSERPAIFMAYETGFAPIKSIIEHAISLEWPSPIHLYWVAREESGHYQENICRSWETALDDYHFYPLIGSGDNPHWQPPQTLAGQDMANLTAVERSLFHAASRIVVDFPDLSGFDLYVSAPQHRLRNLSLLLQQHQLPAERLFVDHIRHYD